MEHPQVAELDHLYGTCFIAMSHGGYGLNIFTQQSWMVYLLVN